MRLIVFSSIVFMLLTGNFTANAQTIAFPGAEGGGKYTSGGRGGKVLFVDNLEEKGPGSLRKAVEAKGPRTIIFRVSGNIELSKPIYIKNDSVTIAGQTAPGDGICLVNYGIVVEADNVILRYLRVRPGDKMEGEQDAISGTYQRDIIIDHCSFSWSNDETASFYNNSNFTMQWCIISESLNLSAHHKGTHGYGGIWGGNNATFHHNLISDHTSRNPRFCGSRYTNKPEEENVDFRNNVVYNWGFNSIYGGEEGNYNIINNYFKPGPATSEKSSNRILDLTQKSFDPRYNKDTLGAGKFFITGNFVAGSPATTKDNWGKGVHGSGITDKIRNKSKLEVPVPHTAMKLVKAKKAYKNVMKFAGANLHRDEVDRRIISEALSGKEQFGATYEGGKLGIIDSPADVGGWPILHHTELPADSDNDGMPDNWEKKHRLDLNNPDDQNLFSLNKEYTNIEVWMNSLVK